MSLSLVVPIVTEVKRISRISYLLLMADRKISSPSTLEPSGKSSKSPELSKQAL